MICICFTNPFNQLIYIMKMIIKKSERFIPHFSVMSLIVILSIDFSNNNSIKRKCDCKLCRCLAHATWSPYSLLIYFTVIGWFLQIQIIVDCLHETDDWTDPEVWKKANPSLGITVGMDKVEAACESAKQNPGEENSFRQLRLNQWVKQAVRWMLWSWHWNKGWPTAVIQYSSGWWITFISVLILLAM